MFSEPGSAWLQAVGQDAHEGFVDIQVCAGRPLPCPPSFTIGTLSAELAAIPYHVRGTATSQEEKVCDHIGLVFVPSPSCPLPNFYSGDSKAGTTAQN